MSAITSPRRNGALLAMLLGAQLLLMSGSARGTRGAERTERFMMRLTSPVVALANVVGGGVRGAATSLRDLLDAHQRNVVLQGEVERLSTELRRQREAVRENERLRDLLAMRESLVPDSIVASVVVSNLNSQTKMIVINRGARDGVRPDMPVVTWGGAVGRVVVADAHHAKVRLLIDQNLGIGGVVQRSSVKGLVKGTGTDRLDLLYVPKFSDVTHGDRVVTSGLEGIFPRGFGVGRVSAISEEPDGSQTIHLDPELDFGGIEDVLVVLERPPEVEPGPEDPAGEAEPSP